MLAHVAQAGFDPQARERAGGRLAGVWWQGRALRGSDRLPPAEAHYLRHVVVGQEWPPGTTLAEYLRSIRAVILDPQSGLATRRYEDKAWQLTIVGRSGCWRGPGDGDWIMVDYRLDTGHWMTAYQFSGDPDARVLVKGSEVRWLRRPR